MSVVGALLKNRRAREAKLAWNLPNLSAPETLVLTSQAFGDGEAIPAEHAGKRAGGQNLSPQLAWSAPRWMRSRPGPGHCCGRSPAPFSRRAGSPACTNADPGSPDPCRIVAGHTSAGLAASAGVELFEDGSQHPGF